MIANELPLEDSSVLRRAAFDAKSPLTVVMRVLLSVNEDVKELMSVSIVIMLWFNEPMFEEWVLIAVASCAVFDWRALILLELPLIFTCRALVVSVCDRTSAIWDCKLAIFELCERLKPLLVVILSQLFDPNTSAIVSRVSSSTAWLAFCCAKPKIFPTTPRTVAAPTPPAAVPAAMSVVCACVLPATAFE